MTRISLRLGWGVFQDSIAIFFFIITDYVTFADSDYCITLNTCLPIRIQWLNYKIRPQKLVSLGERPVVRTNSGRREQ